ncbi:MAG: hypothetical protein HUK13_08960 [Muribaculaceae bacterium]|nr:hypothetical protein [Muribaculaceae bacterium]MCF0214542.1 hypothetical protein [Muribaculaceae bacterium]
MKTISPTDIIYATLRNHGTTLAGKCLSGINSFADIVRLLKTEAASCSGLATLMVRNATRGWTENRSVMLSNRSMPATQAAQLTLF